MEKNVPSRCIFQILQELRFDRAEISFPFVFYFRCLFPQVFQMPFLANIQVYTFPSALFSLLSPSPTIYGIFSDKTHYKSNTNPT